MKEVRQLDELRLEFNQDTKIVESKMTVSQYKAYMKLDNLLDAKKIGDVLFVNGVDNKIKKSRLDEAKVLEATIDKRKRASKDECEVLSKNIIELQEEITELENQIAESKGLCAAECKELGSKFEYFGKACDYLKLQNSNAILLDTSLDDIEEFISRKRNAVGKKRKKP